MTGTRGTAVAPRIIGLRGRRPVGRRLSGVCRCGPAEAAGGQRSFRMVPYGQRFSPPPGIKSVTCDGLVPGADLQLTHWNGNETPTKYYADTSTEIALNFVSSLEAEQWADAVVLNNHFDTDGALSVWTMVEPEAALKRRQLLIQAAEAGDFEEWSSDTGVLVDAALIAIRGRCSSDAEAYRITIPQLPDLLDNIMERQDLWGDAKEAMDEALQALASGRISSEQQGSIGMVVHAPGTAMIPGVVLSRLFSGAEGVRRYLLAQEQEDGCFSYSYQRPGYSWAVTRNRPRIPPPDVDSLLAALGAGWQQAPGLIGIVETRTPVGTGPKETLAALLELDPLASQ